MKFKFSDQFVYRHPYNSTHTEILSDEMLYIASPVLLEEFKKNPEDKKVQLSIKKYSQRASSRCTPFGLFAGCGTGVWTENLSKIKVKEKVFRQTRLDMNVTCEIAQVLSLQNHIKKYLIYKPNNSLYKISDKLRYVEYQLVNKFRSYQITAIDDSDYINEIITSAQDGINYQTMVELLLKYDVSIEEAEAFIDELILSQILFSNLYPNVTGDPFVYQIIKVIEAIYAETNHEGLKETIATLKAIDHALLAIDQNRSNGISSYKIIFEKLKTILPNINEDNLFQTDLYFNHEKAELNKSIQENILSTAQFLNKLYKGWSSDTLKKFRESFYNRYEDQEKSLIEVLDTECGIGFKNKDNNGINLLADDVGGKMVFNSDYDLKWNTIYSLLLQKLINAYKHNDTEVVLSDADLPKDVEDENIFPPSMAVFFSVLDTEKNEVYFKHAAGSSANNLLGRFAHGHDTIREIIENNVKFETDYFKEQIVAEILHLPESRIGNVLLRPHIHQFEIPYLANSLKSEDHIIPLSDLYVSVKGDKVILRSKHFNKEVIPRLSTAHNFAMSSLPAYQFLCDLQSQYYTQPSLGFNWGPLANEFEYLPRVKYKDTIIFAAKWNLKKERFEHLVKLLNAYNTEDVKTWQKTIGLPDLFLLSDGDNELLVDINDELSSKAFIDAIKKRPSIQLSEYLHTSKNALIQNDHLETYTNEIIGILQNEEPCHIAPLQESKSETSIHTKRQFITGSEWLYYKIYCSNKSAETMLSEQLLPFIEENSANGNIKHWFFIRYADPNTHLRLRFEITNKEQLANISFALHQLLNPLIEDSLVEKVVNDTYTREIERYGSNTIYETEQLFCIDSYHILKLINAINDDEQGELIKLKYACLHTMILLQLFGKDRQEMLSFIDNGQLSYFNEHGGHKDLKLLLDNKYRKYRSNIETFLMTYESSDIEENQFIYQTIQSYQQEVTPLIHTTKETIEKDNEIVLNNYLFSIIHMHVNRLFKSKQRTYELLMYDNLKRALKSIEARQSKKVAT
jgi:lantibiotic biosynthesis protein